ncbi:MAG: endonuclease MutS2 [Acutalibacteraceae bacterium]|jgi:DNA mismatch repair protein MutS2
MIEEFMIENEQKHYHALELDKVLSMLAQETSCEDAAERARAIVPQSDLKTVRTLLQETDDAYRLMGSFGSPSFGGLNSCENSLRRAAAGGTLTMGELLRISSLLHGMRALIEWRRHSEGMVTCIDWRFDALCQNKYLEEKIDSAILSEEEMADNASPALNDIRRKIRSASGRVREQLDKMIRSAAYQKYLQDAIVTMRDGRYVVPVKAECRGEIPGLVHDTSASGATVFVEPMGVVEANNEVRVLQAKEKAEIERILTELSAEAGTFANAIIEGYHSALELNVIFAKARLAYKMKASMPTMNDEGRIAFKKARHPLIDPAKVVPTTIELGSSFDTLVITGPNTGGKTVALKTIGLLSLMAMCGLLLPVSDNSEASVFTRVLADIGDEQSIEQSLSTFSAHMTNIISIMKTVDSRSLVLIDELGAGTDPVEGAALARSILENMRASGCRIAATTHYAELKAFALQTAGVENACCEFDVATLCPTYRLLIGVPGRSNAFAISERLGMKPEIVERARELLSTENTRFEEVVRKLEQSRQELEEEKQLIASLRREAAEAASQLTRQKEEQERLRQNEIEKAKVEARNLTARTRAQAEALLAELDELRKNKAAVDSGKARAGLRAGIRAMEEAADPVSQGRSNEGYRLPRELKKGDTVLIFDIDKKASVLSAPDRNGQVEVQAGIIKTRVPLTNLRLVEEKKRTEPLRHVATRNVRSKATTPVKTEVDLRGKTVGEALMDLDQFLDSAVLMGVGLVSIIHGKGTGALRSAVQQHLKTHPSVKSFRLGVYGEGENGVTIAELK